MAWRQHMTCEITVSSRGQKAVWSCELPMPIEVPLAELFIHNLPGSSKRLSLNHRKVLWTYENIDARIWNQAARNFSTWLSRLPFAQGALTIDTEQAGAAVWLTYLSQHPLLLKRAHVRVHHAPLEWLKRRFEKQLPKQVTVEQIAYPGCPWSQLPSEKKRRAA